MPQFVRALCMHTFSDSVGLKDEVYGDKSD